MSIKNKEHIINTNSEAYCSLVHAVYTQFKGLYKSLNKYEIRQSCFYLMLAYLVYQKELEKELKESARTNY